MPLELNRTVQDGAWTTSLCGCGEDSSSCCEALCCPWCLVSSQFNMLTRNAPEPDDLCTCMLITVGGCVPILQPFAMCSAWHVRKQIRQRYGIGGDSCSDAAAAVCCYPCALSQQYREMSYRAQWPGGMCLEMPHQSMANMTGVVPPPHPPRNNNINQYQFEMHNKPGGDAAVMVGQPPPYEQGPPPGHYAAATPPQNFAMPPPGSYQQPQHHMV